MKKLIYSLMILTSTLMFGQIELLKTFDDESLDAYSDSKGLYFLSATSEGNVGTIKIYDGNFNVYKSFNVDIPSGYNYISTLGSGENYNYAISRGIYSLDNKLDFVVRFDNFSSSVSANRQIERIYNEDGALIKEFGVGEKFFHVYYNPLIKKNILIRNLRDTKTDKLKTIVYTLPSSGNLGTNDNKIVSKTLKVYPNPVSTTLTINNPDSESTQAQIFDMSGRMVKTVSFGKGDKNINMDVSALGKGNYLVKVGSSVSKFIKN